MATPNNSSELDKLVSLYQANSDNFRKVFGIMVGIGLFFLLTVILPYFLNIYEYTQNKVQINKENMTIHQGTTEIHNLKLKVNGIQKGIENLSHNINKTKTMMNTQIKKVSDSLSHAGILLAGIKDPTTLEALKKSLNEAKFKQNGTLRFASIALQSFNNSISTYENRIDKKNQRLNSTNVEIELAQIDLKKAIDNRKTLIGKLSNLTERWKEIKSPFGDLPIDFTNLLAILPLAVTSGFFLCSIWLAESIRLRAIIDGLLRASSTGERPNVPTPKLKIYNLYPLWMDPLSTRIKKLTQILVLSIPVIIFGLSVAMIVFAWENAPSAPFPSSSYANKSIYYVAYVACTGLVAYGFWRILSQVRKETYDKVKGSWNT